MVSARSRLLTVVATGLALGCGSSVLSRARDAAPNAIAQHLADARAFDASALVDVPVSTAWNTAVGAVRQEAPIAEASFAERRLATHWGYEDPGVHDGVARQRRVRHHVQLTGSDAATFRATARSEAEVRERETCTEPTRWTPAAADATQLARSTEAALRHLSDIQLTELQFPGSAEDVLPIVSDLVIRRWGVAPSPEGIAFPLRGGWRETDRAGESVEVTVRSTVAVRARPAASSADQAQTTAAVPEAHVQVGPSVQLEVEGVLEWHGVHGDDGTAWIRGDAEPVVRDFFGRLAERLPPMRIAVRADAPIEPRDPEPDVPELAAPPDPLRGRYGLYIRAVQLPLHSPDGLDWDVGALLAPIIRHAPAVIRVLRLAAGDVTSVVQFIVEAARAWGDAGIEDRVAAVIAQHVGQTAAPDIQLSLALPSGETIGIDGPNDSHVAGWTEAIPIVLDGDGVIAWQVWDRDPLEADLAGRGSFVASELANACHPVCQAIPGGGRVCAELQRVR